MVPDVSMTRALPAAWRHIGRHVLPTLVFDGVAPFTAYSLLCPRLGPLHALLVALALPLLQTGVMLVLQRRVNVVGAMVVISLLLSGGVVLLGGSPRLILARESLLSGVFGSAMLTSMLCRRPLVYYFACHFFSGRHPGRAAEFRRKASAPRFHAFLRRLTLVWGLVTLADALLNTYLAFHLSPASFLAITPAARYAIMGLALTWTLTYAHRRQHLSYLFGP